MLGSGELELLREAVRSCGPLPRASDLSMADLTQAIARDKKSVGGAMKWVLLERIGRARIVDAGEIGPRILLSALRAGLRTI
jgi:3-dehydroquinate synthetase